MNKKKNNEIKEKTEPTLNEKITDQMNEDVRAAKFGVSYPWYILLLGCFCLLLGSAVTWILQSRADPNAWIPSLVCNLLSLVVICLYGYFEFKQIWPHHYHVKKKWYSFIFAGVIIFLVTVIISCLLVFIVISTPTCIANFVVILVMTLICVGLCRYGRFHIDKEMYCRTHGVEIKKQLEYENKRTEQRKKVDAMTDEEFQKYRKHLDDSDDQSLLGKEATSGLSDEKFDSK